jgi:DNA repair exonuclease SbcCD ATPase subunit
LGVKRDEMRKLEEIAAAEEKRIELAEKFLEEDAALFDEFLKENGENSTQAVKMLVIHSERNFLKWIIFLFIFYSQSAEEETRKKTEKSNEIKKINTQIMILRSDITKMEDTLKEYQMYKKFLDKVTPQVIFDAAAFEKLIKKVF